MQRYFSKEKNGQEFQLSGDDLYHITRVMRMKDHEEIEVVYEEQVFLFFLRLGEDVKVVIKTILPKVEKREQEIVLVIPLLKEQKMDYILQKATELGVTKIIPVVMERSIIRLEPSKENKKMERWTKICKEASEQSKRVKIPIITEVKHFSDLACMEGVKFVCSTREKENNLKKFVEKHQNYGTIIIVVGPEGGLSEKEEKELIKMGFECVSLGERIMRVETVPLFVLSILNFLNME